MNWNEVMLGRKSEDMEVRIGAESHIPTWTPVTKMKWDMTTTTAWRMIVPRWIRGEVDWNEAYGQRNARNMR